MCSNADGTPKVDMTIIGKAKEPRCLTGIKCPVTYFSQTNAWSDTAAFLKWWREFFLPFVGHLTHEPVLLLMDGCSSHADLEVDRVKCCPPNCTSVHQPMDQGIIAKTKVVYRKELVDIKTSTIFVAETLGDQAKQLKMKAGTMGLAQGHHPHLRDAAELLQKARASVTARDIARCFVKANTLPVEMAAALTAAHGKARDRIAEPEHKALTASVSVLSTSVQEAQQQGSSIQDEDICDLLAELNIEPGKPIAEEAVNAVQHWATIEDEDDVVEAMRGDAVEEMTAQLAGTLLSTGSEEGDEEEEDGGDDNTGRGPRAPPAYAEPSSRFGILERTAIESGNEAAACRLSKAKMAMIAAHSAKPTRQADSREFVEVD
ncbi:unnamed protein product [Ectocarpus sp. CCAP 1310/34]|nr:unnamed protein product [Ectocarpus sp. CCAP 1310/34]